jgi:hypothetical protein
MTYMYVTMCIIKIKAMEQREKQERDGNNI